MGRTESPRLTRDLVVSAIGSVVAALLILLMGLLVRGLGIITNLWLQLLVASICGGFLFFLAHRSWAIRFAFPRPRTDFRILEKELNYTYQSYTTLCYQRRLKLKAVRRGLSSYTDRYHWTGTGPIHITPGNQDFDFDRTTKKNVWQCYELRFHKTLNKGDTIDLPLIFTMEDRECTAVPFFSACVEEPTDKLIFNLNLPENLGVKKVYCEVSWGIEAKTPFETTEMLVKGGKVKWVVPKPKLLHHYEMKWSFPERPVS